jgi:hypothetical protein
MVLHTWTRDLRFHPHVHALVTAGGVALDTSQWLSASSKYLFPTKVMGALLRGKMLDALRTLHARGQFANYDDFRDPEGFGRLMAGLARTNWLVYAKKPFRRVDHVLKYLGRYTHRVAIANSRLVEVTTDRIAFRTKHGKIASVPPVAFLRRFVQHVLPDRFHKIRHFGLYATAYADVLATARCVLDPAQPSSAPKTVTSWRDELRVLTGQDIDRCPQCDSILEHVPAPRPSSRAPPDRTAA